MCENRFPFSNIPFQLGIEIVCWYQQDSSTTMRYMDKTKMSWKIRVANICIDKKQFGPKSYRRDWSGYKLFDILLSWKRQELVGFSNRKWIKYLKYQHPLTPCIIYFREHSGSVVECLTQDRDAAGLSLTGVYCVVVLGQDTFILV